MYGEKATKLIKHIARNDDEILPEYQHQLVADILKENDELYAENLRTSQTFTVPHDEDEDEVEGHTDEQSRMSTLSDRDVNGSTKPHPETQEHESSPTMPNQSDQQSEPTPSTSTAELKEALTNGFTGSQEKELRGSQDNIDDGEKELMVMQARHTAKLWNKRCLIAYHYERLNRLKRLRWEYGNNLPREIVEKLSKSEHKWFATYNDNLFSYMRDLNDGKGLDLTLYATPPKKLFVQVKCVRDYGQFDLEDGQPVMLKKDSIHFLPLSQCEKLIHQGVLEQMSL